MTDQTALQALIERWESVARTCREIAEDEPMVERASALRAASVNRAECAKELRSVLAAARKDNPRATLNTIQKP